jgi:hypothetical protein
LKAEGSKVKTGEVFKKSDDEPGGNKEEKA